MTAVGLFGLFVDGAHEFAVDLWMVCAVEYRCDCGETGDGGIGVVVETQTRQWKCRQVGKFDFS